MHRVCKKQEQDSEELERLLCSGEIYELSELKKLLKTSDNLESLLSTLVTSGKLLHKVIEKDNEQYHLYWTHFGKDELSSPITPTLSRQITEERSSSSVKRTKSKFTSPFLAKRQKVSDCGIVQKLPFTSKEKDDTTMKETDEMRKRELLVSSVTEKEEKLRRLKLVQAYKSKHDLAELDRLIKKWRDVSQDAACQLFALSNHPEKTMKRLLDCLNIDCHTIHYSNEEDNFY